jgi:hypothetical protein
VEWTLLSLQQTESARPEMVNQKFIQTLVPKLAHEGFHVYQDQLADRVHDPKFAQYLFQLDKADWIPRLEDYAANETLYMAAPIALALYGDYLKYMEQPLEIDAYRVENHLNTLVGKLLS